MPEMGSDPRPARCAMDGSMCDRIWYMLLQFRYYGVEHSAPGSMHATTDG